MVTHIYFAPCKSSRRYAIGTVSKLQGHTVATGSTRGSTPQPPPPGEIIFLCVIICFFMVLGFDKGLAGPFYHTPTGQPTRSGRRHQQARAIIQITATYQVSLRYTLATGRQYPGAPQYRFSITETTTLHPPHNETHRQSLPTLPRQAHGKTPRPLPHRSPGRRNMGRAHRNP